MSDVSGRPTPVRGPRIARGYVYSDLHRILNMAPEECFVGTHCDATPGWGEELTYERAASPFDDGLMGAVHVAFAHHRTLALAPDHVWFTVMRGVALHMNDADVAATLRSALGIVPHTNDNGDDAKIDVEALITRLDPTAPIESVTRREWETVLRDLTTTIATHVNDATRRALDVAFTTSTDASRACASIAVMDAMQHYFEYTAKMTFCGIPAVRLYGTVADWCALETSVRALLTHLGMHRWLHELEPLLAELSRAARGSADAAWWRSFYTYNEASGGDTFDGHVCTLYPFVHKYGGALAPTPYRHDAPCAMKAWQIPTALASAPVTFTRDNSDERTPLRVYGGTLGVTCTDDTDRGVTATWATSAVRPSFVWVVVRESSLNTGDDAEHSSGHLLSATPPDADANGGVDRRPSVWHGHAPFGSGRDATFSFGGTRRDEHVSSFGRPLTRAPVLLRDDGTRVDTVEREMTL